MDDLFAVLFLIAGVLMIVFGVKAFKEKSDILRKKKMMKFAGISFGVFLISFIVVGITADPTEEIEEVAAVNKEETEKEKVARELKEEKDKLANEAQKKENEAAKAKADDEQKAKEEAEAKAKAESIPREHKSALNKAGTYAETMHMSKAGIYDQLTSEYGEGFPPEAAQYAIDNIVFDWKENALKKAQTYAETMNMSDSAIYDQLISEYGEKFTPEEAQYAIDNL